jgi:hypothetical protein
MCSDICIGLQGIVQQGVIILPVVLYGSETWSLTLGGIQAKGISKQDPEAGEYMDPRGMKMGVEKVPQ